MAIRVQEPLPQCITQTQCLSPWLAFEEPECVQRQSCDAAFHNPHVEASPYSLLQDTSAPQKCNYGNRTYSMRGGSSTVDDDGVVDWENRMGAPLTCGHPAPAPTIMMTANPGKSKRKSKPMKPKYIMPAANRSSSISTGYVHPYDYYDYNYNYYNDEDDDSGVQLFDIFAFILLGIMTVAVVWVIVLSIRHR